MVFQEFFVKILLGVFVETMFERWWKWYNTSDNSCNNNINSNNNNNNSNLKLLLFQKTFKYK